MKFDPQKHHRRSIRLQGYDYSQAGVYYVTIVTQARECIFGEIANKEMVLSRYGEIIQKWWSDIPIHFLNVETEVFVIMPNHIHGIIIIDDHGARRYAFRPVSCQIKMFNQGLGNRHWDRSLDISNINPQKR